VSATRPRDGLSVREGVESRCGGDLDRDSPSRGSESWRREGSSAAAARVFRDSGRSLGRNFLEWRHRLDSNVSWDQPEEAVHRVGRLSSGKSQVNVLFYGDAREAFIKGIADHRAERLRAM